MKENNLSQYPPLSPKKKWTISILSETSDEHKIVSLFDAFECNFLFRSETQANHGSCCSRLSFPSMTLFTSLSLLLHKKTFFYLLHKTVVGSICAKNNKKVQLVGGIRLPLHNLKNKTKIDFSLEQTLLTYYYTISTFFRSTV